MNTRLAKRTIENTVQESSFQTRFTTRDKLVSYYESTGYWGDESRKQRNAMIPTPSVYGLSQKSLSELVTMGRLTYGALQDVSDTIFSSATQRTQTRDSQQLIGMMTRASKQLLTPSDLRDASIPPVIKVDLVQDTAGRFQIAEVDTYNPRGLGFNVLLDGLIDTGIILSDSVSLRKCKTLETLDHIVDIIERFTEGKKKIGMIVSRNERFYLPSFEILADALATKGVSLILMREEEVSTEKAHSLVDKCDAKVLMIPESLGSIVLRKRLLRLYKNGGIEFLLPPKAFLGSKLLLPHLRSCSGMKSYIPESFLVSRYHTLPDLTKGKWVLKKGQSSGMKSVYFSDEGIFASVLAAQKNAKRASYVLQRYVDQKPQEIDVYTQEGTITQRQEYFRYIAQFTKDGLIGLDITGRPDRAVHGAKDCTMIPSILI